MKLNNLGKFAFIGTLAAGAMNAVQAAVDTAAIVQAGTDVATVGGAVFLVYVAIKAFHLVRRSL